MEIGKHKKVGKSQAPRASGGAVVNTERVTEKAHTEDEYVWWWRSLRGFFEVG